MGALDRAVLAERVASVERHLSRVAARLPADPVDLRAATDASDAVVLHLWQAVQIVIDLGLSACLHWLEGGQVDRAILEQVLVASFFSTLQVAATADPALAAGLARITEGNG